MLAVKLPLSEPGLKIIGKEVFIKQTKKLFRETSMMNGEEMEAA